MEELRSKFPDSAKMKAKYQIYLKKRLLLIQTIKNSFNENELMLELVAMNNNSFEFSQRKRPSLILQQNAGFKSHLSPKNAVNDDESDFGDNSGSIFMTSTAAGHSTFSQTTRN